ncbi:MAG: FAD-dependent oxidoreductase, partial [Tenericutes bacterium]|nr:FAD-dependent oxidoreductase [Mycoplasmatota bacterium]
MKNYDIIVVGGSAAGIPAATTARKYYPDKSICIISDVEYIPIPCGIPYVFGTILDPMKNLIPATKISEGNNLDLVISKVIEINREKKFVKTNKGEDFGYDRLILATGSKPLVPNIKGIKLNNVFSINKNAKYLQKILEQLSISKNIVVVGGGFIGAEMAEECKKYNKELNVSIIEMQNHILKLVYDEEFCLLAEDALLKQDINLIFNEQVVEICGNEKVSSVKLSSG